MLKLVVSDVAPFTRVCGDPGAPPSIEKVTVPVGVAPAPLGLTDTLNVTLALGSTALPFADEVTFSFTEGSELTTWVTDRV